MKSKIKSAGLAAIFIIAVLIVSSCEKKPITLTGPLTNIKDIKAYLDSHKMTINHKGRPLLLPVAFNEGLGVMTSQDSLWLQLLSVIAETKLYLNLDLSLCEMEPNGIFDPVNRFSAGKANIVSITLPNTAYRIADSNSDNAAFEHFTLLNKITGENIVHIGDRAFYRMNGLVSAEFPKAQYIGGEAFFGCKVLETADFLMAEIIEKKAFAYTNLLHANFPEATTIGADAFYDCKNLQKADIPKAQYIGETAFYNCRELLSINLPQAISIGDSVFVSCEKLSEVSFPAAAKIGEGTFVFCPSLVSFILTGEGNLDVLEDGKALIRNTHDGIELLAYPSAAGKIEMNAITKIAAYALSHCYNLLEVRFPAVTIIGENGFFSCFSLVSADFPSLKIVSRGAFDQLTELSSVNIPSVRTIEEGAFKDCLKLESINISSVEYIESEAFAITLYVDFPVGDLNITLGHTAPNLGVNIFFEAAKTVNVFVPRTARGYGDIPAVYEGDDTSQNWGNGFRGKGWDGFIGGYNVGAVNPNITVNINFSR